MACESYIGHLRKMHLKWYKAIYSSAGKELDILAGNLDEAVRELERMIKQDNLPETSNWKISIYME